MTEEELKKATLSEEDTKAVGGFLNEGVHDVTVKSAKFDKNPNGKVFVEVEVADDSDRKGSAKLWFEGGATPYSLNTIRTIFVHNAETKEDKDKLREFFKAPKSLHVISEVLPKLTGKQCWYSSQKTEETYEANDGSTKHRYENNVWAFEPTLKPRNEESQETSHQDNLPDDRDVDEPIDLSEIPF